MSVRFLSNAGRIIMSKAGYDASPALADSNKLFDSDWYASGLVIMAGSVIKPPGGALLTIPFPQTLHYEPAAYAYTASEAEGGAIGIATFGYTTKNSLVINYNGGTRSITIRYIVFAVSI